MTAATAFLPLPPLATPSAAPTGAKLPSANKVAQTAREFEATFLAMLLKEMRQTLDPDDGGLFPGDAGDVQGGMFDLFLSQHLADAGGIGLASVIERQLQPPDHASTARPQPPAVDRAAARPPSP